MVAGAGALRHTGAVQIDAVLFDFGNTLFAHASLADTIAGEAAALGHRAGDEWAAQQAARIDAASQLPAELARGRDLSARVWQERFGVLYAAADDEVPGLGAAVYRAMHAPERWIPYASTAATLQAAHGRLGCVGVVSNTGWDVRTVFAHHGLEHLVSEFVLSYEIGVTKPAPEIFWGACAALGSAPHSTLMVGDDPVADAGAVRAGMPTVLLPVAPPAADNGLALVTRLISGAAGGDID